MILEICDLDAPAYGEVKWLPLFMKVDIMSKMHADEFQIDQLLVQKLIQQQFPEWAGLELKPVLSAGTDHALYKLGNKMVLRLPKIGWAVAKKIYDFRNTR